MSPHWTPSKGKPKTGSSASFLFSHIANAYAKFCLTLLLKGIHIQVKAFERTSAWTVNNQTFPDPKKMCWCFIPTELTQHRPSPVTLHWQHPRGGGAGRGKESQVSLHSTQRFCWHRRVWRDAVSQAGDDCSSAGGSGSRQEESHVGDTQASPARTTTRHPCVSSFTVSLMKTLDNTTTSLFYSMCNSIISKTSCHLQMMWLYIYNDPTHMCMKYLYLIGSGVMDDTSYWLTALLGKIERGKQIRAFAHL